MKSSKYTYSTGEKIQLFSQHPYSALLAIDTVDTLTVPNFTGLGLSSAATNGDIVAEITVNKVSNVWVAVNATAAKPTTTFGVSTSELVPLYKKFKKIVQVGDVLSFISDTATTPISVVLYQSL